MNTLLPFQQAGLDFLEHKNGVGIIADEMGLGKTVQALAYLQWHPELRPAVVVCPASLKLNWQREANKWVPGATTAILSGRGKAELPLADVYIINYDIMDAWTDRLAAAGPRIVVCDEAHYMKTTTTKRTKATRRLIARAGRAILLTGTPVLNRPRELWPLLNTIAPRQWPDFFRYAKRYCDAKQRIIKVRGQERLIWDFDGASNLQELYRLTQPYMIRRRKADVLRDLPAKRRVVVPVELDDKARKRHEAILAQTRAAIRQAIENDGAIGGAVLAQIEQLKQDAALGKLPPVIEWVKDFTQAEKLVIFATHRFVAQALIDEFGAACVSVTGDTAMADRQAAVDRFQADDTCRLFVGNIKAAGVGLTLTAASNVAFVELAWVPGDHDQAEDRCHRIGQTDSVTAWYLLAAGTIDEDIFAKLERKRKVVATVTDGTADADLTFGTDVLREVAEALIGGAA